ncbi:hypothetical protein [Catenulispora rubra]|uniref:hypothetical protein n=1 Tax=Catenulispora rubra TaxID=280293 RepID=UPI0018927858|nr:hypothetical protein [Catenulispora rubra]
MTDVERGDLDTDDEEEDERRWVVCVPVWEVIADEPVRRELIPGVNEVAAWRAEREAAQRQVE